MKNTLIAIIALLIGSCTNGKHADYEKNTEAAKAYLKLHEQEDYEAMLDYIHDDIQWQMPGYGMGMVDKEGVKAAILGYQAAFENMSFEADYWLPGVNQETGLADGSTRVYGTWNSTHSLTGKEVSLNAYHTYDFKDGKIIGGGDWFDLGGMMNILMPPSLNEGNLIGIHTLTVNLNKGSKMDDFINYFKSSFIPNYENAYPGMSVRLVEGIRGAEKGSLGLIWTIDSDKTRDMYWNNDGTATELNQEIGAKLEAVNAGLAEIGSWTSVYTDWKVH